MLMIRAVLLLAATSVSAQTTLTFTAQWQTGLFQPGDDVHTLNPHVYRPEEFAVNDLVYEGLCAWDLSYVGLDGINGTDDDFVVPSLAASWTTNIATVQASGGAYEITFNLRQGV